MLVLGLPLTACATVPEAAGPMTLGAQAAPPPGFVAFCQRNPAECGADSVRVAALDATPSAGVQPTTVAAIASDASAQAPRPILARYDWSGVFASSRATTLAASSAANAASNAVAVVTAPKPQPATLSLSAQTWTLLKATNDRVNRAIARQDDLVTYGQAEVWNMPLQAGVNGGDCEDYALEKRHALIQAGVPAKALSIAVVNTAAGESHAVLLVNTDKGEFALDNLTPWVLPWSQTGYVWRERQVAGSASDWAFAVAGAPATQVASLR